MMTIIREDDAIFCGKSRYFHTSPPSQCPFILKIAACFIHCKASLWREARNHLHSERDKVIRHISIPFIQSTWMMMMWSWINFELKWWSLESFSVSEVERCIIICMPCSFVLFKEMRKKWAWFFLLVWSNDLWLMLMIMINDTAFLSLNAIRDGELVGEVIYSCIQTSMRVIDHEILP